MEKKLTDEEIVKALEICAKDKGCGKCPYKLKDIDCGIGQRSENDYLKLIQRLQKDYANLKERYVKVLDLNEKVITDQKEEIERLTKENARLVNEIGGKDGWRDTVKGLTIEKFELQEQVDELEQLLLVAKTNKSIEQKKTVKEYAEKLKLRLFEYMDNDVSYDEFCKANIVCGEIDDIAKEYYGVEVK